LTLNDHQPKRLSVEAIVICAIAGIVLPIGWFVSMNANYADGPEVWPGNFTRYLVPMLCPQVFWPFLPFVGFGMVSMGLALGSVRRFAGSFVVRFGLMTGTILALQYAAILAVLLGYVEEPSSPSRLGFGEGPVTSVLLFLGFSTGIPLLLIGLWVLVKGRFGWRLAVLIIIPMLLLPAAVAVGTDLDIYGTDEGVPLFLIFCIPFWWLTVSLALVVWLTRRAPKRPFPAGAARLVWGGWLVAYAVAWGLSIARLAQMLATRAQ